MFTLTPGANFIISSILPPTLIPASAIFLIHRLRLIQVPTYVLIGCTGLSLPLYFLLNVLKREIRDRRAARAMGARMVPRIRGKLPGNWDVITSMNEHIQNDYFGTGWEGYFREHGYTVNFRFFWEDIIFTCDPQIIKLILATDFTNYEKGERFHHAMESFLGTGVFNSDGDMWKFHRSMTRPFFSRDRITHFDIFDRHTEQALEQMKLRMRAGYATNFQDLVSRFTLDSATSFLFGSCVNSLTSGLPYPYNANPPSHSSVTSNNVAADFAKAFVDAQSIVADRERYTSLWPLLEIFKDKTTEPMSIVNAYVEPIVKEAIEKRKAKIAAGGNKVEGDMDLEDTDGDETFLDNLVKQTSDPKVLKDETLNIMLAGRDTTASTLTFIIYFLAMYPNVMDRLREEVLTKVGPSKRPTFDDIRDMKYLRAVINETMRLYPVVPFNVRDSINATTWPSADPTEKPFYIPAGVKVPYSVYFMHRRTDLWGPDALEFDPDRFLDDRLKKYLTPNPFIFLPFNAGPRICLGQQFAYNEMSFFLIRLLQNFTSVTLDPSAQSPDTRVPENWKGAEGRKGIEQVWPKSNLTLYANGGLWVKMTEAEMA